MLPVYYTVLKFEHIFMVGNKRYSNFNKMFARMNYFAFGEENIVKKLFFNIHWFVYVTDESGISHFHLAGCASTNSRRVLVVKVQDGFCLEMTAPVLLLHGDLHIFCYMRVEFTHVLHCAHYEQDREVRSLIG